MNEITASASVKLRSVDGGRSHGVMQFDCAPVRKMLLIAPSQLGSSWLIEPIVSMPGITSHQLAINTRKKMVATHGKNRRPFVLPATSSQGLSSSSLAH